MGGGDEDSDDGEIVGCQSDEDGGVLDIWDSTEDYWGPLGRANCTLGDMTLMMVIGDAKRDDDSGGNILVERYAQQVIKIFFQKVFESI